MRRERVIAGLAMLVAIVGIAAIAPGKATAASPSEICADLADGQLNGSYTPDDLASYQAALRSDPTIQGYCSPLVVVVQCVEVAPNTPGAQQASNGTWYANAPNGNAEACAGTSRTTTTGTTTSTTAATTTTAISTTSTTVGVAGATSPGTTTTTGVLGASKTKLGPAAAVPATQTTAAPLASTRTVPSGSLPFTGAQLGIFAVVGAALLLGGLALRATARKDGGDV